MINKKWPNFVRAEIECPCCQLLGIQGEAMDALQALRDALRVPLKINSAYRCPEHNRDVGGARKSQHVLGAAFDISIRDMTDYERGVLLDEAMRAGFTGFGFYETFLHVDIGPPRSWGNW